MKLFTRAKLSITPAPLAQRPKADGVITKIAHNCFTNKFVIRWQNDAKNLNFHKTNYQGL